MTKKRPPRPCHSWDLELSGRPGVGLAMDALAGGQALRHLQLLTYNVIQRTAIHGTLNPKNLNT